MLMRRARYILVGAVWVLVFAAAPAAGEKKLVLEVKKSGGEYASVQEAVNAAPAGAVIRIGPGVYEEQVKINKPLTLEGSGWERTAIITRSTAAQKFEMAILKFSVQMGDRLKQLQRDEERAAIMEEFAVEFGREHATLMVADTSGVVIRGLKLSSPGKVLEGRQLPVSIVRISDAAVELSDCVIVGSPGHGIEVIDASEVTIRKCLVAAVWNTGRRHGYWRVTFAIAAMLESSYGTGVTRRRSSVAESQVRRGTGFGTMMRRRRLPGT
jgi:nitrous oxidase accessory protein NosD